MRGSDHHYLHPDFNLITYQIISCVRAFMTTPLPDFPSHLISQSLSTPSSPFFVTTATTASLFLPSPSSSTSLPLSILYPLPISTLPPPSNPPNIKFSPSVSHAPGPGKGIPSTLKLTLSASMPSKLSFAAVEGTLKFISCSEIAREEEGLLAALV